MMGARAAVARALGALRIHDALAFSWFGERFALAPERVEDWPENALWEALVGRIQVRLYNDFYTQGAAVPTVDRRLVPANMGRTDLLVDLSRANLGAGPRQRGWTITGVVGDEITILREGLTVRVPRHRFTVESGTQAPGVSGALQLPRGLLARTPGYYLALGDRVPAGDESMSRVYWNLTARSAVPVLGALTGGLNRARIAFAFKALSDSSAYTRCDAGVLYVERGEFPRAADLALDVAGHCPGYLKPAIPVFTQRLADGLAWADDPRSAESFGLHRCELVAAGAVAAHRGGADPIDSVENAFAEAGISLDEPHCSALSVTLGAGR